MDYIQVIILGIIQGVTEWLPISSQAMVFLFSRLFFNFEHVKALEISIWLHSGTLLAAVVYFRQDIYRILISVFKKNSSDKKNLLIFLSLATVMTGIIALPLFLFLFWFELPEAPFTIIIGLFLIIVAFSQKKSRDLKIIEKSLNIHDSLIVGLVQGLAVLPGFSRSGLTIATLLFQKYSLKNAFYLSFLMSIPIIFLAQIVLPIVQKEFIISSTMLVGTLTAGIVGFITIKSLLKFAEKFNFFKATLILSLIHI